jgi:guanylate kinase
MNQQSRVTGHEPRATSYGKLVVISGPSGVGKGTICEQIARRLRNVYISLSVTTRPKAPSEIDGKDYWFVSRQEFQRKIDNGLLLEYAEVFGNFYGTPKDKVQQALKADKIVILEIDVQGGRSVKALYPDAVMIFILPPDRKELARRLTNRGRDEAETAKMRLGGADDETAQACQYYEHKIVNDDLSRAVQKVINIITG